MIHHVPLVRYINGVREVVGTADIEDDGEVFKISATISDETVVDFIPPIKELSIGYDIKQKRSGG